MDRLLVPPFKNAHEIKGQALVRKLGEFFASVGPKWLGVGRSGPTPADILELVGRALYGRHWQRSLARDLDYSRATMDRHLKQGRVMASLAKMALTFVLGFFLAFLISWALNGGTRGRIERLHCRRDASRLSRPPRGAVVPFSTRVAAR
jgi:hypothetical protein